MQSNSRSQTRIDHDDVVAQFNKSYPEIGLKAHHLSFLLEILTDSHQNSEEVSSKKRNTIWHTTRHPSQNGTRPMPAECPPLKEGQHPGRARFSHKCALAPTNNLTEGDDMLSHRDFLACAAAAVSQSERLDLTESTVCYMTKSFMLGSPSDSCRLSQLDFLSHI